MKFTYDSEADALNIRLSNASFADTIEVAPGVLIDVDENGEVISIEMLDVRKQTCVEVQLPNLSMSHSKISGHEEAPQAIRIAS